MTESSDYGRELAANLAVMLQKYEIYNDVLAIELAIFVLHREKEAIEQSLGTFKRPIASNR